MASKIQVISPFVGPRVRTRDSKQNYFTASTDGPKYRPTMRTEPTHNKSGTRSPLKLSVQSVVGFPDVNNRFIER